jgi:ABC-type branched-subunit amino acid transport system substrate-binding protein
MICKPLQFLPLVLAVLAVAAGGVAAADERVSVGALLPLTGKQAALGNRTLDGIIAGLGLFDGKRPAVSALRIENYGDNPADAARAVEKLAAEPGLMAILGPPETAAAREAARAAQAARIPLLVLGPV